MQPKTFLWISVFVGSTVGGFVPKLWGGSLFSGAAMMLSLVGAAVGLVLGFYIARNF